MFRENKSIEARISNSLRYGERILVRKVTLYEKNGMLFLNPLIGFTEEDDVYDASGNKLVTSMTGISEGSEMSNLPIVTSDWVKGEDVGVAYIRAPLVTADLKYHVRILVHGAEAGKYAPRVRITKQGHACLVAERI